MDRKNCKKKIELQHLKHACMVDQNHLSLHMNAKIYSIDLELINIVNRKRNIYHVTIQKQQLSCIQLTCHFPDGSYMYPKKPSQLPSPHIYMNLLINSFHNSHAHIINIPKRSSCLLHNTQESSLDVTFNPFVSKEDMLQTLK